MMKKTGILVMILCLTACGFRPLYKQNTGSGIWAYGETSVVDEMAQIKIPAIADRFGQQLRNDLLDLMTPKGVPAQPKYRLVVELVDKIVTQQAMRNDVTATNERIDYRVEYRLYQGADELVRGDSFAFVSYDILANPYSTTMSQKKAETDAAKIIANDIALRIGAYFYNRLGNPQ